nr:10665_t:CDS:2 [Entrophospora candida]
MSNLTINLSKELEKELNHLKETTKKPKSFHVKEALIKYLEDLEDIRDVQEHIKTKDPIKHGEPLSYEYKGFYRYRFSDYRVIYEVKEKELLIAVIKIGHRREVY